MRHVTMLVHKTYEINYRAVYSMQTLGKISNVLRAAAKVVAEISMDNAVLELKYGHAATNVIVHSIN